MMPRGMSTDRIPTFNDLMRRGQGRVKGRVRYFFKRLFTASGWRRTTKRLKDQVHSDEYEKAASAAAERYDLELAD